MTKESQKVNGKIEDEHKDNKTKEKKKKKLKGSKNKTTEITEETDIDRESIKDNGVHLNETIISENEKSVNNSNKISSTYSDELLDENSRENRIHKISLLCVWILSIGTRLIRLDRPHVIWYYIYTLYNYYDYQIKVEYIPMPCMFF